MIVQPLSRKPQTVDRTLGRAAKPI